MDAKALVLGELVKVGPAYRMADAPPYAGHGTYEADAWTGRLMRVVAIHGQDVGLASDRPGVTEEDEEVAIIARRLTPA